MAGPKQMLFGGYIVIADTYLSEYIFSLLGLVTSHLLHYATFCIFQLTSNFASYIDYYR